MGAPRFRGRWRVPTRGDRVDNDAYTGRRPVEGLQRNPWRGSNAVALCDCTQGVVPRRGDRRVAADTAYLRAKLPRSLKRAAIHLLQQKERDALNAMGHHATPLLLRFDSRARLRLVAPVSPDPVEVVAIRRAVTHLASSDPLK